MRIYNTYTYILVHIRTQLTYTHTQSVSKTLRPIWQKPIYHTHSTTYKMHVSIRNTKFIN